MRTLIYMDTYPTCIVAPNSLAFDLVADISERLGLRVNLRFLAFFETRSESRHHLVFRSDHLREKGKFMKNESTRNKKMNK